ncbi:MAG: 50S ribosomal protein L4 [Alphaproteobacteria bacterium]|nr:50S ribosomal protein L4 [Alphaproteobacteria bacterium]
MQCDIISLDNDRAGEIQLADGIFGVVVRPDIMQRVVLWQLAGRRAGTHKTKTRGEITATGAKAYRQKGTGRARHGSRKSGIFVGGGRAFGPLLRDHGYTLPKKVRRLGLKSALSSKQVEGKLVVIDAAALDEPKTTALAKRLASLDWGRALIIDGGEVDGNFLRAAANIPCLDVLPSQGANVYDILRADTLVLTKAGVEALETRLS